MQKSNINTAIETSGFANEEKLMLVLKYCDFILFDIKETDEKRHEKYTGVSFEPIFRNLNIVSDSTKPFVIRLPIIPGLNDRTEHLLKVKSIAENMKYCKGIEIMPYHILGKYKYDLLQREYPCSDISEPDKVLVEKWNSFLRL